MFFLNSYSVKYITEKIKKSAVNELVALAIRLSFDIVD